MISPNLMKNNSKKDYKGVKTIGDRARLSNVNACFGLSQLKRFNETKKKRLKSSRIYDNLFDNAYQINKTPEGLCRFIYVVNIQEDRNKLCNILIRVYLRIALIKSDLYGNNLSIKRTSAYSCLTFSNINCSSEFSPFNK